MNKASNEIKDDLQKKDKEGSGNTNVDVTGNSQIGAIGDGATVSNNTFAQYNLLQSKNIPKHLTNKIPLKSDDEIIGRTSELKDIYNTLHEGKNLVLVNGIGGIGKTTLAQVYLTEYQDKYEHVAWVTQTGDDVKMDFSDNNNWVKGGVDIDEGDKDTDSRFIQVMNSLRCIGAMPNLLIIDDVTESIEGIFAQLPKPPQWHVLATSRQKISKFNVKEVGFLSKDDAKALFRKYYGRSDITDEQVENIVELVDCHTLIIELLAKTANKKRWDFEKLASSIKNDEKVDIKGVDHNESDGKVDKITSYLRNIFNISSLNDSEKWLMQHMACLPNDFNSYVILEKLINLEAYGHQDEFADSLNSLKESGWLLYNDENDSYKMHCVIADVVKLEYPPQIEDMRQFVNGLSDLLSYNIKYNPVEQFQWVSFGKSALNIFADDNDTDVSLLQNNLSWILKNLGQLKEAEELLRRALASYEKNFEPDHPEIAISCSNLATVLKNMGQLKEAEELLRRARASYEKNFEPDHPNIATSRSNLALVLKNMGQLKEAEKLLRRALASAEKNFEPDHPYIAINCSNLALVLGDMGQLKEAEELLRRALASEEKNFEPDHPSIATSCSNLALVLGDMGQLKEAKELAQRAVTIFQKSLPPNHPNIKIVEKNLQIIIDEINNR